MRTLADGIVGLGTVIYALAGLAAFGINLIVILIATEGNFLAFVAAFLFFPATIIAVPWYALLAWGNPYPLAIGYGGIILAFSLVGVGTLLGSERAQSSYS